MVRIVDFFNFRRRLFFRRRFPIHKAAFFQFGSETYNYRALFDKFVVGSVGGTANTHTKETHIRTCTGGTSKIIFVIKKDICCIIKIECVSIQIQFIQ